MSSAKQVYVACTDRRHVDGAKKKQPQNFWAYRVDKKDGKKNCHKTHCQEAGGES